MAREDTEVKLSLRILGAWSGILQVPIQTWSVSDLRAEVSRVSGFEFASINMISGGRTMKDSDLLRDLGLKANAKILLTRSGKQQAAGVIQEKERAERLERIRAAAESMSKGSGENSLFDNYELELQNQSGDRINMKSESARAVTTGMILFAQAQKLIKQSQYKDALDLLFLAEESFSLGDQELLKVTDNVPLVQIDIVWCLFMLQDIGGLGVAKDRLSRARAGLQRAHGQYLERLHAVQGSFCPELAIYVRLELLEGVVAYHSGLHDAALKSLETAWEKAKKLDVSDESVAMLVELGFKSPRAKKALRIAQSVEGAVAFLMEQKEKKEQRREEDKQYRRQRTEQQRYGRTASGKAVDMGQLNSLAALGYDRAVVAEALKQADNDCNRALDILTDPSLFDALQRAMLRGSKRRQVSESELLNLIQMGFDALRATAALENSRDLSEALEKLVAGADASSSNPTRGEAPGEEPVAANVDEAGPDRDTEMEDEIARDITGDPLEDYDTGDVVLERQAIERYLSMLHSEKDGVSTR